MLVSINKNEKTEQIAAQTRKIGEGEREKLTFRHLLTHWGGFQHNIDIFKENGIFCSFEEYIERIKTSWQKYSVGTRFSYSNVGFDLAAFILGKISGMSFPKFMQQEVYGPLGMNRSFVLAEEALEDANCATGHIKDTPTSREMTLFPEIAAGAQFTCVKDMSRFLQMHINGGKIDGKQFLLPEILKEMYSLPFPVEHQMMATGMGIGVLKFRFGGTLALSFFGDGPGYAALHQMYPEIGIGWLIQANQVVGSYSVIINILNKIREPLIEWKLGSIPDDLSLEGKIDLPPVTELTSSRLDRLAGKYISRMLDIDCESKDGVLIVHLRGEEIPLQAHSETVFSGEKIPFLEFELEPNGRPLTLSYFDNNGQITVLDYDSGPADEPGPNLKEWTTFSGMYSYDYGTFRLYSAPVVKNGHLYLMSSMNNKEYHLSPYESGVFFTADGQNVIFEEDKILMPDSTWKRDDITVDKVKELHRQNVDDIRIREISLDEYIQILEKIGDNDGAEEIKRIKEERYPKEKQ
ncbi:class A beta-lactamase-related serine hydrolase [Candidatus Thorarchaeota archaeon]|nr:MAG: class A beta-lactamase-related serine hydrolase [Candidatus Thorarchaeota archaeon]